MWALTRLTTLAVSLAVSLAASLTTSDVAAMGVKGVKGGPLPAKPFRLTRRDFPHRLRLVLGSTTGALNSAVEQILALCRRARALEPEGVADLEISLREALANAVFHGNGEGTNKRVFARCYAGPGTGTLIVVRDEGDGFDPQSLPDPTSEERKHLHNGRGVFLMGKLMDCMEYRRGGREVLLYRGPRAKASRGRSTNP